MQNSRMQFQRNSKPTISHLLSGSLCFSFPIIHNFSSCLLNPQVDTPFLMANNFPLNFQIQALNVFGFFWGVFFVSALGEMVLAATFATWYWTFHKKDVPYFTLTVGLGRSIR